MFFFISHIILYTFPNNFPKSSSILELSHMFFYIHGFYSRLVNGKLYLVNVKPQAIPVGIVTTINPKPVTCSVKEMEVVAKKNKNINCF